MVDVKLGAVFFEMVGFAHPTVVALSAFTVSDLLAFLLVPARAVWELSATPPRAIRPRHVIVVPVLEAPPITEGPPAGAVWLLEFTGLLSRSLPAVRTLYIYLIPVRMIGACWRVLPQPVAVAVLVTEVMVVLFYPEGILLEGGPASVALDSYTVSVPSNRSCLFECAIPRAIFTVVVGGLDVELVTAFLTGYSHSVFGEGVSHTGLRTVLSTICLRWGCGECLATLHTLANRPCECVSVYL